MSAPAQPELPFATTIHYPMVIGPPMPSTSISRAEYDPATAVFSVWFLASGRRYDYEEVPQEMYEAYKRAFAKGRFFNENIRNKFRYRFVVEAGESR